MLPAIDQPIMDTAVFSKDRVYRYLLTRRVGVQDSTCLFIMLNPSTADETQNDPTVTRCIRYARRWGFGKLEVCNIFAYRATNPKELYTPHPSHWPSFMTTMYAFIVGPDNNDHITNAIHRADRVVCAWGNHGELYGRGDEVREMVEDGGKYPMALKITKKNQPVHPLYQRGDAELIVWTG